MLQATYKVHKVRIHAIIYALVKVGDKCLGFFSILWFGRQIINQIVEDQVWATIFKRGVFGTWPGPAISPSHDLFSLLELTFRPYFLKKKKGTPSVHYPQGWNKIHTSPCTSQGFASFSESVVDHTARSIVDRKSELHRRCLDEHFFRHEREER